MRRRIKPSLAFTLAITAFAVLSLRRTTVAQQDVTLATGTATGETGPKDVQATPEPATPPPADTGANTGGGCCG